ncbi:nitrogenase cofactor biosynthesis protein NifB [Acetobacterium fimetarium]|uniref:FeMo cofactor biosynthesis protein NifB n=1 Tax=Acetobacterium fimetarium TaxID=52691 RepID=A0ABR6WVF4_9FIRM|nr:nitrogenase cofactor biosynthesis protein NifB [Acetobacterium fimetarium]MBC3804603.1 nitrogenase cofactor biosynthesis protein NifB [Acetobacterium fimetarium]
MSKNLVNLNVNPCKMCMPMGTANAFYGIQKCMSILHGSQGCSTYIRRHMATHYNEPVDIASSSLTEEGTVYGGERNLIIGLENLIKLYDPEVIGVSTTCLAETIGEDVEMIIHHFYESHPDSNVKIIPVKSAGYGGTQFEGFIRALRAIVSHVDMATEKNNKINIITSMISPADTRYLKDLLDAFGLDYILLPDLSENLDGEHQKNYSRLPAHGTPISEIQQMAGARATIELSDTIKPEESPGVYLFENYDVPYLRLNLPIGLRDTDALIDMLSEISKMPIPESIAKQRGRYLDGMIDSHKYNAAGRIAVFGEPDFVVSAVRLCCENGVMPVIAATGSNCPELKAKIEKEIAKLAAILFVDDYVVLNDVDFETIEAEALRLGANIMLGNSDGRRIEEKHQIPLIRCAFPIHDRVGGQRVRTLGYEGSQMLLDQITNTLLKTVEGGFREELYNTYYNEGPKYKYGLEEDPHKKIRILGNETPAQTKSVMSTLSIEEKTANHPCFSCGASHKNARMHLPIAPKCNIQCNYCVRKFDCANESRPGVTTEILSPEAAFEKYKLVREKVPNLTVVGIAGPGDALANFEETKKALTLIHDDDPNVTFCVSTNGLMLPYHVKDLVRLNVSHVTVTVNAVDPEIGARIYKHVDFMGHRYHGIAAASLLLANQLSGIKMLIDEGIIVKINTVTLMGVNDAHIEEVVKAMKEMGCFISNIMPLIPVKGSAFETLTIATNQEINAIRKQCGLHLNQMYHCKQCRADAIGKLDSDVSLDFRSSKEPTVEPTVASPKGLRFAVASKGGMLVDQHFGHATEFYIYDFKNNEAQFLEKRQLNQYCLGVEECEEKEDKFTRILNHLKDCDGVIAMRIGDAPARRLEKKGIQVFSTYDRIEEAVKTAARKMIKSQNLKNVSGGI